MFGKAIISLVEAIKNFKHSIKSFLISLAYTKGFNYIPKQMSIGSNSPIQVAPQNDLRTFFDQRITGRGIWKWDHYFDIYNRHLSKFREKKSTLIEIGIYSGGSLDMWKNYFGRDLKIIGVDIEPACVAYQDHQVEVIIGDQEDLAFWNDFLKKHHSFDMVIDDGGHTSNQQMNTFLSLFDKLNPGGVYVCEDVHGHYQEFSQFCLGMAARLSETRFIPNTLQVIPNSLQEQIKGIYIYPFVYVIEKLDAPRKQLFSQRNGTEWQPFYEQNS